MTDQTERLLVNEVTSARELLEKLGEGVITRVHVALGYVQRGRVINNLGELQQLGPQFDAACARYTQALMSLEIYRSGLTL